MGRALLQGVRWLARRPVVSVTNAACLAVGLAVSTAASTLLDAVVFRPFGLRESQRLVPVWETDPSRIDLGFATGGVTLVDFALPAWKYGTPADEQVARDRLQPALRELPSMQRVAGVSVRPFRFGEIVDGLPVRRAGDTAVTPDDARGASRVSLRPEYFDALGQPIIEGRAFTAFDRRDTGAVAIVSRPTHRECRSTDTDPRRAGCGHRRLSDPCRSQGLCAQSRAGVVVSTGNMFVPLTMSALVVVGASPGQLLRDAQLG